MNVEPVLPTINSLSDWSVGLVVEDDTLEVRMRLTDREEARAWAVWLLDRDAPLRAEEKL